jgi:hypothetical protein
LFATTRWLAGGSYLDIANFFGLSSSCFFHPKYFLWECLDAIDQEIQLGFQFDEEISNEPRKNLRNLAGTT